MDTDQFGCRAITLEAAVISLDTEAVTHRPRIIEVLMDHGQTA